MKRVIKFRMWNFVKDNPPASKMFYDVDEVTACLRQQLLFDNGQTSSGYSHTEDGNVFMQFTNLHDKNGNPIYEGDILQYETSKDIKVTKPVRWNRYEFSIGDIPCWCASPMALIPHKFGRPINHVEIIGNEFENPELITVRGQEKIKE